MGKVAEGGEGRDSVVFRPAAAPPDQALQFVRAPRPFGEFAYLPDHCGGRRATNAPTPSLKSLLP